jgi:hypothetical protein
LKDKDKCQLLGVLRCLWVFFGACNLENKKKTTECRLFDLRWKKLTEGPLLV